MKHKLGLLYFAFLTVCNKYSSPEPYTHCVKSDYRYSDQVDTFLAVMMLLNREHSYYYSPSTRRRDHVTRRLPVDLL